MHVITIIKISGHELKESKRDLWEVLERQKGRGDDVIILQSKKYKRNGY